MNIARIAIATLERLPMLALGLVVASNAHGAEPAVITFEAPTRYTDGSPIEAGTAISYSVYQGERGKAKTKVATITQTGTTITTGLTPGTEYCFAVTSIVAGQESAQSAEGCKAIPALVASGGCDHGAMMFEGIIEAYRWHKERKEKRDELNPFVPFRRHVIKPAVDILGNQTYELRLVWFNGFASGEKVLATNPDKAVLQRAIEHLQSEG